MNKTIVVDVDNTLSKTEDGNYAESLPILNVLDKLKEYHKNGYYIILYTARNMRKYNGNIGKISAYTLPILIDWLNKWEVPYDEIIVGKPWCENGYMIDDRAIRPDEFVSKSYEEIMLFLSSNREKKKNLLKDIAVYISDCDFIPNLFFYGWTEKEIKELELEALEKNKTFPGFKYCTVEDAFNILVDLI